MSEKMNPVDREMLMAATLAAGLRDVDTDGAQAVENLQEILFQIALRGGATKMRIAAQEMAKTRAAHQAAPPRNTR